MSRQRTDRIAAILFFVCYTIVIAVGAFLFGVAAHWKNLPPVPQIDALYEQVKELLPSTDDFLIVETIKHETPVETLVPGALAPGLIAIAGDYEPRQTAVRVMDRSGRIVHEWRAPWPDVWPAGEGTFPTGRRPARNMYLHGLDLLPDGSFVSNFEHLSSFRMDICGDVVWKLDNLGHHSAEYDGKGAIWVSAETYIPKGKTGYPHHASPLRSWTLQKIAMDGTVLKTIPVIDLLYHNGLDGLLYMSSQENASVRVSGDTLHLNDVESFPPDMTPGYFSEGDLAISLRNINTVMVFNEETLDAKLVSTGAVLRQHDVDFISGSTISVFDNRHPPRLFNESASQIVEIDGRTGGALTVLSGDGKVPFFTHVMGAHERLPNGNIIVVESDGGRVLEYSADGDLLWRYSNRWNDTQNLRVFGAKLLPAEMDVKFFEEKKAECEARQQ